MLTSCGIKLKRRHRRASSHRPRQAPAGLTSRDALPALWMTGYGHAAHSVFFSNGFLFSAMIIN
jgi:hypothetical protein